MDLKNVLLSLTQVVVGATIIAAILGMLFRYKYRRKKFLDMKKVFISLTFVSTSLMFFPLYVNKLEVDQTIGGYLRVWLVSLQHGI